MKGRWLIAHRGASRLAPENTLAALQKAHQSGARWIETDVQLTKDGVPVILHDSTLNRTTDAWGRLCKTMYMDVRDLDVGSWFHPDYATERMPTLAEWLQNTQQCGLNIHLECKASRFQASKLIEAVVDVIKAEWTGEQSIIYSSFCPRALRVLREKLPDAGIGIAGNKWSRTLCCAAEKLGCVSVHLDYQKIKAAHVQAIHDKGLMVLVYTVNEHDEAERLFEMGVDGIFTDNIHELLEE